MDEVAYFMDWDLEAVVRGCSSSTTTMEHPFIQLDGFISANNNNNNNNNNINLFAEDVEDNNMLFSSFAELSESTGVVDELEELYKPFYPSIISATAIVTANPQPTIIAKEEDNVKVKASSSSLSQKVVVAPPPQQLQQVIIPFSASASNKSKRRKKSVKKRVVKKVTAGCDAWAWRKYGQKPIKGSPYPRSYYRCSSSKGCLARKQVERNPVDPAVFLVTYTAGHNHPHPTRRNSLAGSTRIKTTNHNTTTTSSSSCAVRSLSPRTPLVVQSMDEQHNNNDATTTTVVTTTSISSSNNNNTGLKEDAHFVELLDGAAAAHHGWFPQTQDKNTNNIIIDEEEMMLGLDYRLLQIEIQEEEDGCHFMGHHFAAAAATY